MYSRGNTPFVCNCSPFVCASSAEISCSAVARRAITWFVAAELGSAKAGVSGQLQYGRGTWYWCGTETIRVLYYITKRVYRGFLWKSISRLLVLKWTNYQHWKCETRNKDQSCQPNIKTSPVCYYENISVMCPVSRALWTVPYCSHN